MQPDQPAPNYDFILNPQTPKRSRFNFGGRSKYARLLALIGALLVLAVAIWIIFAVLSSSSKASVNSLIGITQQQNEIVRVAGLGVDKARSGDVKGLAETISLSVASSQKQLLDVLKQHRIKVSAQDLGLKKSSATDSALDNAASNGTYDEVLKKTLNTQLNDYRQSLQTAFGQSKNSTDKDLLNNMYQQSALLVNKTN